MLPREPRIVDIAAIPDKIRIIKDFMFPSPNLMRVLVVQPEQKVIPIPNSSPPDIEDIVLSLIFM